MSGALVYAQRACLPPQGDEEQRARRIESRRRRKVDLHTRLVTEYDAAISDAVDGGWLFDDVEEDVLGAMHVGPLGELARVGRLETALGRLSAWRAGTSDRSVSACRDGRCDPVPDARACRPGKVAPRC